jgi:4-amino-4-deoxy-L-arabinose transferase-like glycosyltransferase
MTSAALSVSSQGRELAAPLPLKLIQAVAILFLAVKIGLLVFMQPFMDETYYFLWGQHAQLSYFDHPSLIGWTEGLSAAIFGWNVAALREPPFLTLCGDLLLLYFFARRLARAKWIAYFWVSAALFLTMPMMLAVTGVAVPDHLLVFFGLLALYLLHGFLQSWDGGRPDWRLLYTAGAAVGLAMLSKYYGVLIGAAFLLTLIVDPRYRRVLLSPHLYGALLVALLLQTPVIVWNLQHGLASFGFAVGRSHTTEWWQFVGTPRFLLDTVVIVSPFLVWPMLRAATAHNFGPARPAQMLMWVSTLLFLAVSTVAVTIIHWNLLTYVATLPLLAAVLRSRLLLIGHFVYASVILVLFAVNYAIVPLSAVLGFGDPASSWGYGWDQIAGRVAELRQSSGAAFIAGTDYALASELGFALHDREVTSLSPATDAFDFWFDAAAMRGRSAIIVADGWRTLAPETRAQFRSVEDVGTIAVTRFDRTINNYKLYIARDFEP